MAEIKPVFRVHRRRKADEELHKALNDLLEIVRHTAMVTNDKQTRDILLTALEKFAFRSRP